MSKAAASMDVYLFEIDNGADGFARFVRVYQRHPSTTHDLAKKEIAGPKLPAEWYDVTGMHAAGGLDMRFAAYSRAVVFVRLPNQGALTDTEFGDYVVEDLKVQDRGRCNIVRKCDRYASAGGKHLLCSFEIDIPETLSNMTRPPLSHRITRFPIMFDFVDASDNMSPVFKDPSRWAIGNVSDSAQTTGHDQDDTIEAKPFFGHGGIHPRGGSSMILLA
jgi:hypothetical protein